MLRRQQLFVDKLVGIMKDVAQFGGNRKKKVCLQLLAFLFVIMKAYRESETVGFPFEP